MQRGPFAGHQFSPCAARADRWISTDHHLLCAVLCSHRLQWNGKQLLLLRIYSPTSTTHSLQYLSISCHIALPAILAVSAQLMREDASQHSHSLVKHKFSHQHIPAYNYEHKIRNGDNEPQLFQAAILIYQWK